MTTFRLLVLAALLLAGGCSVLPSAPAAEPTLTASAPPTQAVAAAPPTLPPAETVTPAPTPLPAPTEPRPAAPASINPGDYTLTKIADGLTRPVYLTHADDGSGRLFVIEQRGLIRIIQNGALRPEPFLDIVSRVNSQANERGLLGLAFHPDYAANGLFFVHYSDRNGDTAISRFSVSGDPDRADPNSEALLLWAEQPYANHNGGEIAFGPDGYLYIGLGDGGSAGDPENRAQTMTTLLGKLLRIDVNAEPYAIPPDNPYADGRGGLPEIWASGLRNPWRFSFDRATGDLYIADVGQNAYEEVSFQPAGSRGGENYGWRFFEGLHPFKDTPPATLALTAPVAEYSHGEGGCSVTGGYVYRGAALPALNGVYFFGDYCSGIIWSLQRDTSGAWQRAVFGRTDLSISSFGEGQAGEVYVLDHGGAVYQLVARP
jgi:glucose/arabinose dehydrogenase